MVTILPKMKQILDYSKLQEPEKTNKAIKDCKFYLGIKPFNKLVELMSTVNDERGCRIALSFGGISGFPATAMINKYMGVNLPKCDNCCKRFTEKGHDVFDENFNRQNSIKICNECFNQL